MEPTFVEQFRRESADCWVETPCLFQEKPAILREGSVTTQHMIERGRVHAIRMSSLRGLIELLRVAEQHDGPCGLRYRQHIRERHLGRLIDEEHVNRVDCIRTSPKPSGPACDPAIVIKSCKACRIVSRESKARPINAFLLHHLDASEVERQFLRSSANLVQEVADHLVAVGGYAYSETGVHHLSDHTSAGIGLPATRRSLDRHYPTIQRERQPKRGCQGGFTLDPDWLVVDARCEPHEEVSRRLIRSVTLHTTVSHMLANPQQCISKHVHPNVAIFKKCFGMEVSGVTPFFDFHPAVSN
jgi:hypothetical protein